MLSDIINLLIHLYSCHCFCMYFSHIPAHSKHPIILSLPRMHSSVEDLLSGESDILVMCNYYSC